MMNRRKEHVEYQRSYFDTNCAFFRQPIPEDVVQRTRQIVRAAKIGEHSRILDVGTGMGVLIQHFEAGGVKPENIVGCDLSAQMLAEAKRKHTQVQFWQGDFAELPPQYGAFDAVFFNACFGNFFDQTATIENAARLLNSQGRIVVSHPMGNAFVLQLKENDPNLVLHPLPPKHELEKWCEKFSLTIDCFRDEPNLYIAILKRA